MAAVPKCPLLRVMCVVVVAVLLVHHLALLVLHQVVLQEVLQAARRAVLQLALQVVLQAVPQAVHQARLLPVAMVAHSNVIGTEKFAHCVTIKIAAGAGKISKAVSVATPVPTKVAMAA